MRRVVVTGMGIISSIGNNKGEVLESLREGRSGIEHCPEYAELGFRSHIHGSIKLDVNEVLDRKLRRFMGDGAAYNYLAMVEAVEDSGLTHAEISNERTGLVMGSGGTAPSRTASRRAIATRTVSGGRSSSSFLPPLSNLSQQKLTRGRVLAMQL